MASNKKTSGAKSIKVRFGWFKSLAKAGQSALQKLKSKKSKQKHVN